MKAMRTHLNMGYKRFFFQVAGFSSLERNSWIIVTTSSRLTH